MTTDVSHGTKLLAYLVVTDANGEEMKIPMYEGCSFEYRPIRAKAPREDRSFTFCGPKWN